MSEIFYYHLTTSTLEQALPGLLERCLDRGWRAAVQTTSDMHMSALDQRLWTWRDDSFLPHASPKTADRPQEHPIWICLDEDNANAADVRFLVHGASCSQIDDYQRIIRMFDGHDDEAVSAARACWKSEREAGHELTYWQQSEEGGWKKKG